MAETLQRESIDCAYQKRGSLQLAGTPEEEAELLESARLLNADGFSALRLDRSDLAPALQNAGFQMGVLLPEDGELHPGAALRLRAEEHPSEIQHSEGQGQGRSDRAVVR